MGKHKPEKRNDFAGVVQQGRGRAGASCGRLRGGRRPRAGSGWLARKRKDVPGREQHEQRPEACRGKEAHIWEAG